MDRKAVFIINPVYSADAAVLAFTYEPLGFYLLILSGVLY
jgi:hypothetical protein